MAEVAIRAARVVAGTLVVPVADHASGKHNEREKRKKCTEDAQ